ncbi:MAG: hypothetical protein K8S14_08525 [Actinomycetia bacterium]|nr:hypothetical protein [Actinomycetes bacterium]
MLSPENDALFQRIDDWFIEHLPDPPFYKAGNPDKAITWFKIAATEEMLQRLSPLVAILDKHGIAYDYVKTDNPGRAIYEDAFQVATVPEIDSRTLP